jgi:hypothetical protein
VLGPYVRPDTVQVERVEEHALVLAGDEELSFRGLGTARLLTEATGCLEASVPSSNKRPTSPQNHSSV